MKGTFVIVWFPYPAIPDIAVHVVPVLGVTTCSDWKLGVCSAWELNGQKGANHPRPNPRLHPPLFCPTAQGRHHVLIACPFTYPHYDGVPLYIPLLRWRAPLHTLTTMACPFTYPYYDGVPLYIPSLPWRAPLHTLATMACPFTYPHYHGVPLYMPSLRWRAPLHALTTMACPFTYPHYVGVPVYIPSLPWRARLHTLTTMACPFTYPHYVGVALYLTSLYLTSIHDELDVVGTTLTLWCVHTNGDRDR